MALTLKFAGTSTFKYEAFSDPYTTPQVITSYFIFINLSRIAAPHISGQRA
jgi:hypothetical protein